MRTIEIISGIREITCKASSIQSVERTDCSYDKEVAFVYIHFKNPIATHSEAFKLSPAAAEKLYLSLKEFIKYEEADHLVVRVTEDSKKSKLVSIQAISK